MQSKSKNNFKRKTANFFGALGYLFNGLQWVVVIMAYFAVIARFLYSFIDSKDPQVIEEPVSVVTTSAGVSTPTLIAGSIITAIVILISIYVFFKIPSTIVKTSHKVTQKAAEHTTPIVLKIRHQKDTKKNRNFMTPLITVIIKAVIVIVPLALSYASKLLDEQALDYHITMYLSVWLAGFGVICFGLQYILAKLLTVNVLDLK